MNTFNFFGMEFNLKSEAGLLDLIHKLNASHKDLDAAVNAAVARAMDLLESPHNNKRIMRLLLESIAGSKNRHIKAKSKKLVAFTKHFAGHFVTIEEHDKGNFKLDYTAKENCRYFSEEIPAFSQWDYKAPIEEKPATPITSKALDGLKKRLAVSDLAVIQELQLALETLHESFNSRKAEGNALEKALKQGVEPEETIDLTVAEQGAEALRNEKVA